MDYSLNLHESRKIENVFHEIEMLFPGKLYSLNVGKGISFRIYGIICLYLHQVVPIQGPIFGTICAMILFDNVNRF